MSTVTTHLRNQILAAVDHAFARHRGSLSVTNTITADVVATIEGHAACPHCPAAGTSPADLERARIVWWLRAGINGPAAPNMAPAVLEALNELAEVIEKHPERFAEAPAIPIRTEAR